ncbi:hypothetical protein SAMN06273567_109142 [Geodermatophilus aquaeductus]|jgi:hypothetical protein|uniref:YCII-related domain-containing protein n=1 Tax=Geodermatophilus aquaeductus TaxID=1564161 RepID=A0A521FJ32_9ACTN|nr:hypothetical protein SAMN06273567_109142 [Geodermatophilus aquaeductus]
MPRYLVSFDDGPMGHIPDEDLPAVDESTHAVVQEAEDAGVWVFGGGVARQQAAVVGTDGTVTDGPVPETKAVIGGRDPRGVVAGGGAGPGRSDRAQLPVRPGGPRDRVRPGVQPRAGTAVAGSPSAAAARAGTTSSSRNGSDSGLPKPSAADTSPE